MSKTKNQNAFIRFSNKEKVAGYINYSRIILRGYRNLSLGAKETYQLLLDFAGNRDFCFPLQETLAEIKKTTITSVSTQLRALEKNFLIRIEQQGLGRPNIYYIEDIIPDEDYLNIQKFLKKITEEEYQEGINWAKKEKEKRILTLKKFKVKSLKKFKARLKENLKSDFKKIESPSSINDSSIKEINNKSCSYFLNQLPKDFVHIWRECGFPASMTAEALSRLCLYLSSGVSFEKIEEAMRKAAIATPGNVSKFVYAFGSQSGFPPKKGILANLLNGKNKEEEKEEIDLDGKCQCNSRGKYYEMCQGKGYILMSDGSHKYIPDCEISQKIKKEEEEEYAESLKS